MNTTDIPPGVPVDAVPLGMISVDHVYQRHVPSTQELRSFVPWIPASVGLPWFSHRADGRYYVIDGQRRCLAATAAGLTNLPGLVWEGTLTVEQEAQLFNIADSRTEHNPLEKFMGYVAAGDPGALEVQRIIRAVGLEVVVVGGGGHMPWNAIKAITAVRTVFANHGSEHLEEVLSLLAAGFHGQKGAFTFGAIPGMSAFLLRYPSVDRLRVEQILRSEGPNGVRKRAIGIQQLLRETTAPSAWGQALRTAYNLRLRTGRLGPWPETVWKE